MTARERTLGLMLGGLLIVAAGYYVFRSVGSTPPVAAARTGPVKLRPEFVAELEKFRAAENIEDLEQRCLQYPDPAEFHWKRSVIEAFCHLRTRRVTLSWQEIQAALQRKDTALLQRTFDDYLERSIQSGQHGFITWVYWWQFQNSSDEERDTIAQWIDEDPASAYALVARGMHFMRVALDARGTKYMRDTPPEQIARMREYLAKSRADLEEGLKRNPRLIAAYHGLLTIAQFTGDDELRESAAHEALAIDPADQWVYDDWLDANQPKWGGSIEGMRRVARLAARHARDNPLLLGAKTAPECYEATELSCSGCNGQVDFAASLALFRKAAKEAPTTCFLEHAAYAASEAGDVEAALTYYSESVRFLQSVDARMERAGLLARAGQREWALEDLARLVKEEPRNARALDFQGYIFELEHRYTEAEAAYLAILAFAPEYKRASLQLSYLYIGPLKTPDKAAPIVDGVLASDPKNAHAWLYKAALAKGKDENACREALRNYLKYVNRADPAEQMDITRAEARLKEFGET